MFILAPSVYAADQANLESQIRILESCGITCLHVDVMDGKFVPLKAFGVETVRMLRTITDMKLDVHLMTEHPENVITDYADAGVDVLTVHLEACDLLEETIGKIRSLGMKAGVAVSPETGLKRIPKEVWRQMDVLQIMTKRPGRALQHFIPGMFEKVKDAKKIIDLTGRPVKIEVDGDITKNRLGPIISAGAEIIVVGGAMFNGNIRRNVAVYSEIGMSAYNLLMEEEIF